MDIEEAKERLKQIKKDNDEIVEEAKTLNTGELTASLSNDSIAIETVLNTMYKSIEESAYYRDLVKLERKEKEQLKKSLKGQIKKKDRIINEMAKYIGEEDTTETFCGEKTMCDEDCAKCVIEYFTNKAENVGE